MPAKELDIRKLTKAVRFEIERLRANVESLESRLAAMDAGQTNIKAHILLKEIGLPNDATVEFVLGDERMEANIVRGRLQIRSNTGMLAIYPGVTNTITIASAHD